ncbi:hypothetical protein ADEAN_000467700 [Angomonas deanei]|uniref:Uncharacterized protein n=1 Tax=Angomonas deanei TaxID=59799 RepID=A0A7G2CCF3_9TRYP|nr:hypothetical protein ADEAN_000467700 [Angomonas deanei]
MSNVDVSRAFHGVSNEKLSRAASASVGGRKSHADITGRRAGNSNSALGYATHDSFISAESKQPLSTTALYLPPKGHDSASNSFLSSGTDSPPARRRADTVIPPRTQVTPHPGRA